MRQIKDYSYQRHKSWCIHCGYVLANVPANRDHVPSRSLLSAQLRERGKKYDRGKHDPEGYLPQVLVCKSCNSGFSDDEMYLLCVLHAIHAGSLCPDRHVHREAARVLRSNRHIVRSLNAMPDGQMFLFPDLKPFTIYPDMERIKNVIIKNARGHVYHELGEPVFDEPSSVMIVPINSMSRDRRDEFEHRATALDVWPEVGSRMMLRVLNGEGIVGGWIEVEEQRYSYAVDWSGGMTVRTVIWDYLASEVHWE